MIATKAFGPWPYPKDNDFYLTFFWSASFYNSDIGSAPGDSTKITGVLFVESANDFERSKGGGLI